MLVKLGENEEELVDIAIHLAKLNYYEVIDFETLLKHDLLQGRCNADVETIMFFINIVLDIGVEHFTEDNLE